MEIRYNEKAIDDLKYWKKSGNSIIQNKIANLLINIVESPFEGIGKPEPLKYNLSGKWSRRINEEHRIIYEVIIEESNSFLKIYSLKGHYFN